MSTARNILISLGVYWFTRWAAVWLDWLFSRATDGIIYGDGVLYAIAEGLMTSMGRTAAGVGAGVLVALTVTSRKSEYWALIIAALYVVGPGLRTHYYLPPTMRDRVWQGTDLLFPAIACVAAAAITSRLLLKQADRRRTEN